MVSIVLTSYTGEGCPDDADSRTIADGPLYGERQIREILGSREQPVTPLTENCIKDIADLELDSDDLVELVSECLSRGRFRNSEWCDTGLKGNRAACDAYELKRREWIDRLSKEMEIEYFLKFGISRSKKTILLISCHPPRQRR